MTASQTEQPPAAGDIQEFGDPQPQTQDPRIGGEVEAGTGRLPNVYRWLNIGLYVAAIMYLILNRVESYAILLVLAEALAAWTVYFATQKKPPEP